VGLLLALQPALGLVVGNLVSTSAGMTCSFVANGRWTFGGRLTLGTGLRFLAATGTTMWLLQPAAIALLEGSGASALVAKLIAVGVSVLTNYAAYRFVVWRPAAPAPVRSDRRPSGPSGAPSAARR